MRWVHGLQRKLGVQPTGRQTFETGFEPVGEIYRSASAELFGTVVIVLATGFAIMAAGEAIHATTDIYPYDTAAANVPPGNTLAELGPQGVLSVAIAVSSTVMLLLFLFSRVSGGHFNCAITLAFMMQKRISSKRGFIYMLAQFLGSFVGEPHIRSPYCPLAPRTTGSPLAELTLCAAAAAQAESCSRCSLHPPPSRASAPLPWAPPRACGAGFSSSLRSRSSSCWRTSLACTRASCFRTPSGWASRTTRAATALR